MEDILTALSSPKAKNEDQTMITISEKSTKCIEKEISYQTLRPDSQRASQQVISSICSQDFAPVQIRANVKIDKSREIENMVERVGQEVEEEVKKDDVKEP